jgi:hypothetical protein
MKNLQLKKERQELETLTKGQFVLWFGSLKGYKQARKEATFEEIKNYLNS